MTYEQRLIAAGIPPEQAARDAWADEVVRFNTREEYTREGYWREQMADHPSEFSQGFELKYGVAHDAG